MIIAKDSDLFILIKMAIAKLEESGDIIVCSNLYDYVAGSICDSVSSLFPNDRINDSELRSMRSLIYFAINDKKFFDWEMPTLTGLTADGFEKLAEKLPHE